MKIFTQTLSINQMDAKDWTAMCHTEQVVEQMLKHYGDNAVLTNPNTGEVVDVEELRRVLGILDFLSTNRVVEVSYK